MKNTGEYKTYPSIDGQHPYAGLYSYREIDSEYFFGRKRETAELADLIGDNVLTVVFGKSGVGKTSLLRAGLIPHLKDSYFLPIYLRIDFASEEKRPIVQAKETMAAKIKELDPHVQPIGDLTLWEYFSTVKIVNGIVKPLLFFDQFEEIFTIGKNNPGHVNEFVTELADLIENRTPLKVRQKSAEKTKRVSRLDSERHLRVIISLREAYLAQLETLYRYIPSLRFSRYRVSQMKGIDALDAVLKPGKEIIKDREVAVEAIKKIPVSKDADYSPDEDNAGSWENKKIAPFLLSLFCYQVNEKRLEKQADEISRELINDVNAEGIIKDYYEENIARFKPGVKIAIEDLLVTPEGNRKLQDSNSLKTLKTGCVTDKDIERLVDRRIIRKEIRTGIEYVELIHDVLGPILKESRVKRKEEETRQKEAAQRKKRYRRVMAAVTAVILVILAGLLLYVRAQEAKIKMEKKRVEGERQKGLAYEWAAYSIDVLKKDPQLSFRLVESAFEANKDNLVAYRALLSVFYDPGFHTEVFKNKGSEFSQTVSEGADFFAVFSPDGKRILTATSRKAVLWNLEGARVEGGEFETEGDLELNQNAAFSPDGKYIVFCTKLDDRVMLWDLDKNEITTLVLAGGVNWLGFSPDIDRKTIIAASRDKKIRMFDLTGTLIETFEGHEDYVNFAAFSRDGKYIVSASWDKTARLWDLKGNPLGEPLKGNSDGVKTAAFSPDGQYIVTGAVDGSVRLFDIRDHTSQDLGMHEKAASSAVFSPNGDYILTGSEDKTVRLLTLNNFLVFEFKDFRDIIHIASFSPDGKYILIAPARGPAHLRLIDPEEIIALVNSKGNVRPLREGEKQTYNLRKLQGIKIAGVR